VRRRWDFAARIRAVFDAYEVSIRIAEFIEAMES
jgi:hypothetical protein